MIKSANKYTLSEVFPIDKDIKYVIPKYQREYTWNKDNWEELFNDIQESQGDHFIGSLICVDKSSDAYQLTELEIVDGQQRLTTISLLFAAIYQCLNEKKTPDDMDLNNELYNLKYRLIQRTGENEFKLELSHQNSNANDYKSILRDIGVISFNNDSLNKGNRRIYKAFRYFLSRLENFSLEELRKILSEINRVLIVKIEVNSHSDAFVLFESLNNRGVPLSAIDLIKNKLLAELEKRENITIDDAFEKWKKIIEYLPEYSVQERFLRHFYNAYKSDSAVKVDGISKATRSNLIKIFETLIERDAEDTFNKMYDKSRIYHDLLSPEEENFVIPEELDKELIDLVNVKAAPSYALLLFLFSLEDKKKDVEFFRKTIIFLMKYFIRRNITDFPNTRNLDQIFIDLIEEMTSDPSKISYEFISEFLSHKDKISSLENFKEKLNGDLYDLNVDATRFVLSKIEEVNRTKETFTDFWQKDKSNKLIWTIEHIFPEGNNIPKSWVDMIADGDRAEAKKAQEEFVHKLGNLTLTGFNQSLSNFDFERKRDRKDKKQMFIGYKNKLFLNEDLKDKNKWTVDDIKERTNRLIDLTLEVFKLEGEK